MQTTQRKTWRDRMAGHRFAVLLCVLILLMLASPIAKAMRTPALFSRLVILSCVIFMLIAALFAISRSRRQLIVAGILSVPTLLLQVVDVFHEHPHLRGWAHVLMIIFLGYVVIMIIKALFQQRRITGDMLCASICGYLLIGICWAFVYSLVDLVQPGSFMIAEAHQDIVASLNVTGEHAGFAVYYSFITLSTLGYGDVFPVLAVARVCSYSEAAFGQIYLAVLVARLVGLHISQTLVANRDELRDGRG